MSPRFPVFRRSLYDLRWLIVSFGVGLALYGASMVWLFPTFEGYLADVAANYPREVLDFFGGGEITDPAGFMTLEYQSFAVLILVIYAVVASTGQLAGEEGRGSLESLLAQPISRTRLFAEKAAAFVAGALLICAIVSVGWLLSVPFVDLHGKLTLLELAGATFGSLPVVLLFGALGFWLGAIAPTRGAAAGILAAGAVASYLAASIAQAVAPVEALQYVSPYYYSDAARWLIDGPVWWHQLGLLLVAAVVFALAVRSFAGREVGVGVWQPRAFVGRRRWVGGRLCTE